MQRVAPVLAACVLMASLNPKAAERASQTLVEWNRYVSMHGGRPERCPRDGTNISGSMIDVTGGAIHHWCGSTLVHGRSVDAVVLALMYPGTPPPQPDILESRVLSRAGDALHVYMKVARRAIVTVTYETEHDVTFFRLAPGVAASRSLSTRITDIGDGDRGYLWALNSYWRYTQAGHDVRIDLESLSLSRDMPKLIRPVAEPIVNRIARESVARTLETLRVFLENAAQR